MSVYFYGCISLDGYLATKDHNLDWLYESGSIEDTSYKDFYNNMDITIMGRKTYEAIKNFDSVASMYPTTTNYIFSNTLTNNIEGFNVVNINISEFVNAFKDKNIWVIGGNTLVKPLLDNNMIDKMYIQIAPVLLGEGISLFTQDKELKRFKLKEVNKYLEFAELVYEKIK